SFYTHTLTPGSGAFPSGGIAVEKQVLGGDASLFVQFLGGRINTLDLTVPQEGIVKAVWGIVFKNSSKLSATAGGTPTLFAEDPFAGYDAYLHLNDSTFVGNATHAHKEFSMTLTNNVDESVYCIGSRFRTDLPEGIRHPSGRLSMYFLDSTEYDYFKNEVVVPVGVTLIHHGCLVKIDLP